MKATQGDPHMPTVGQICNRAAVVITPERTVSDAARLMRKHHVGSVIVVDVHGAAQHPIGIITDRDIAVEVVALELDPRDVKAGELMGATLVAAREEDDLRATLQLMRLHGVRRLPVIRADGALVGIVASDDLVSMLAEDMAMLAAVMVRERAREATERKPL
jgi:CBS domain-containing protein